MLIKEIFMVCNYCGATIIGNIKQCPDCGMPTDNLTVPIPAPIKTKKVRKKEIDPNEIPKNKRAIPSIILTGLSGVLTLVGVMWVLLFYFTSPYTVDAFAQSLMLSINSVALGFYGSAMILAIVGGSVSIAGVLRKNEKQTAVFICLCASVFAFILAACAAIIYAIYLYIPFIQSTFFAI